MRSFHKYLAGLGLGITLLSGCSGNQPQTEVETKTSDSLSVSEAVTVQEPGAIIDEETEDSSVENPLARYDKELNCSDLRDADAALNCEIQVREIVASALLSEIRQTFDGDRCQELPTFYVDDCEAFIKSTGVVGPVSADELALFSEATRGEPAERDGSEVPEETLGPSTVYDTSRCAQLKTEGYQEYCEARIQRVMDQDKLDEIFISGASGSCDELTDTELKTQCQLLFDEEVEALPPSVPLHDEVVETPAS